MAMQPRGVQPLLPGDIPESLGVMSALETLAQINVDGVGSGIPEAGAGFTYREQGDFERNTPPCREGYRQKWVRVEKVDQSPDTVNYRKHVNMGYTPRYSGEDTAGYATQSMGAKRVFALNGSLLMEIPEARAQYLDDQQRHRSEFQSGAVPFDRSPGGISEHDERYARLSARDRSIVKTGRDAASLID